MSQKIDLIPKLPAAAQASGQFLRILQYNAGLSQMQDYDDSASSARRIAFVFPQSQLVDANMNVFFKGDVVLRIDAAIVTPPSLALFTRLLVQPAPSVYQFTFDGTYVTGQSYVEVNATSIHAANIQP